MLLLLLFLLPGVPSPKPFIVLNSTHLNFGTAQATPKGLLETLPLVLSPFGLLLPSTVTVVAFKDQWVSKSPGEAIIAPATHPQTLIH